MSITINLKTANKKELADLLNSLASIVKASANQTVTFNGEVLFNKCDE